MWCCLEHSAGRSAKERFGFPRVNGVASLILNIIPEAKSQGQGGIEKSKSGPRRDRSGAENLAYVRKHWE
jgi:hypothetical protein